MKNYCSQIPLPLAEKLKEKGMPMEESRYGIFPHFIAKDGVMYFPPTFASCFDWLMSEKGLHIIVEPYWDFVSEFITDLFEASVVRQGSIHAPIPTIISTTWHEAAETAIEKALELL